MNDDNPDDRALSSLPERPATGDVARRVRRQALAELAMRRAHGGSPWMGAAMTLWSRVVMPVGLASVVGVYLAWAFEFAGALYR